MQSDIQNVIEYVDGTLWYAVLHKVCSSVWIFAVVNIFAVGNVDCRYFTTLFKI